MGVRGFQQRLSGYLSQGIVKGSSLSIVSQAVVSGSNFVTGIIIAKATGASDFGTYSLIAAAILTLQGIQQALITSPMIFLLEPGENHKERTSQYFVLQVWLSVPLAVGAAIAIEYFLHQWSIGQALGILSAVFFLQLQEFSRTRLYIDLKANEVFVLDITNHGLRLTLLVFLWQAGYLSVSTAFIVLALASGITCLQVVQSITWQSVPACMDLAKRSFQYGRWLLLESVAWYLSVPIYLYISSALLSNEATGGLSAAISLMGLPNVLVFGLMNLAVPIIRRRLIDEGYGAWRSQLTSTGAMVVAGSLCLYAAISLWGAFLLSAVYSQEFTKYANVLPIIGGYYCFLIMDTVLAAAFRTAQAPQIGAVAKLWSSAITLSVAYPFVNLWGVEGAAAGLVLTSATWLAIYVVYIYKGALRPDRVLEQKFKS